MIEKILQLLDWIYRKNCYFCRKSSSSGIMCQSCFDKIEVFYPDPITYIDGISVYAASSYNKELKKLIRGLKYHNKKELARSLAELLYNFWKETELSERSYEIIPMPLFPSRQKQRGYNHMYIVAQEFSKLTGYSINTEIAKRVRDTKPQYKLSRTQRFENMKNAFKVYPEKYNNKPLLLFDDICTTGITLKELIKTFKANNIDDIVCFAGSSSRNF